MKRTLSGMLLAMVAMLAPGVVLANGGYTQTVGLQDMLKAKLGTSTSSGKSSTSYTNTGSSSTSTTTQTLPTKTLPTQTQTITQQYIQPVIQPIQQVIQPVVQTVVQPVITQVVAQPIYLTAQYNAPVYANSASVDTGSLISGNPYLNSGSSFKGGYQYGGSYTGGYQFGGHGFSGSGKSFGGNTYYATGSGSYSNSSKGYATGYIPVGGKGGYGISGGGFRFASYRGYGKGGYGFGGFGGYSSYRGFGGFAYGPISQSFTQGASNSFAFGGAAYSSNVGTVGSVSVNVGNNTVQLPGFESLGKPSPGETLQKIYNYSASFQVDGVKYTVDVSSRLTASFASPSASPSSVHAK